MGRREQIWCQVRSKQKSPPDNRQTLKNNKYTIFGSTNEKRRKSNLRGEWTIENSKLIFKRTKSNTFFTEGGKKQNDEYENHQQNKRCEHLSRSLRNFDVFNNKIVIVYKRPKCLEFRRGKAVKIILEKSYFVQIDNLFNVSDDVLYGVSHLRNENRTDTRVYILPSKFNYSTTSRSMGKIKPSSSQRKKINYYEINIKNSLFYCHALNTKSKKNK